MDLISGIVNWTADFSTEFLTKNNEANLPISFNQLLSQILDVALTMTKTECGSIMILNHESRKLTIQVSRGIQDKYIKNVHPKLGEGIAGLAAKENKTFILDENTKDNRIKGLLRRPQIKQAIVMPITTPDKNVIGVLNLHTIKKGASIKLHSSETLKNLSHLTASAIENILS